VEHDLRLTVFWLVHIILLGLFGLEFAWVLSKWLQARVPGLPADASRWRKLAAALCLGWGLVFSRRVSDLLRALLRDGLLHRRLYRLDLRRWGVHLAVLGSWLLLGALSILTGFVVEILPLLGLSPEQVASIPLLGHLYQADVWWVALLNESLGLLALGGMLLVLYRHYLRPEPQLRTTSTDRLVLWLLTLIALSGFPTETLRLLADYTTPGGAFGPAPAMLPLDRLPAALYGVWDPRWAFVGYPAAVLLGSLHLPPSAWAWLHSLAFWVHFALASGLLFLLPFSRFFHVLASPVIAAYNGLLAGESGQEHGSAHEGAQRSPERTWLAGATLPRARGQVNLAHFTLRQMVELEACTRCGECIESCPTFAEVRSEEIHPLRKTDQAKRLWKADHLAPLARLFGLRPAGKEELVAYSRGVYQCTLCARCQVVCPIQIDTRPLWIALREQLVAWGLYPEAFDLLRERVLTQHNIAGEDNARRLVWTENMEAVPEGLTRQAGTETVYFVGCVAALYPRVYGIPQSFVQILVRAGEAVTTLAGEEWCCGFPLQIAGLGHLLPEMVRHNVEAVRAIGARRLVTTCPSCYHMWAHEYPRLLAEPLGFQVLHSTELLTDLIAAGRIELHPFPQPVTYHDPCDLGRTSGIYDAPRQIIQALPGVQFREMADNREMALCCGGGGDAEMADPELTAAVAQRRIEQAQETGARVLISACQQCSRTLVEAARRKRLRIRVMDISEVVWRAMQE